MRQMLLHLGLSLLGDLCKLALSLLADYFQGRQHVRMSTNGTTDIAFIELHARLLLQLILHHLRHTLINLAINLRKLLNAATARGTRGRRQKA